MQETRAEKKDLTLKVSLVSLVQMYTTHTATGGQSAEIDNAVIKTKDCSHTGFFKMVVANIIRLTTHL